MPTPKKRLLTHEEANYRSSTSHERRCGVCAMYVRGNPTSCTLVQRPIRADMVCRYFEARKKDAS